MDKEGIGYSKCKTVMPEMLATLFGVTPSLRGSMQVGGEEIVSDSPFAAIRDAAVHIELP